LIADHVAQEYLQACTEILESTVVIKREKILITNVNIGLLWINQEHGKGHQHLGEHRSEIYKLVVGWNAVGVQDLGSEPGF
jgi:hypothetical protein